MRPHARELVRLPVPMNGMLSGVIPPNVSRTARRELELDVVDWPRNGTLCTLLSKPVAVRVSVTPTVTAWPE